MLCGLDHLDSGRLKCNVGACIPTRASDRPSRAMKRTIGKMDLLRQGEEWRRTLVAGMAALLGIIAVCVAADEKTQGRLDVHCGGGRRGRKG